MIALKTAPRLEKDRALQRERRPIHGLGHFKNLARIQTTGNAALKWEGEGALKWDLGYYLSEQPMNPMKNEHQMNVNRTRSRTNDNNYGSG